jgi:hypothetical protein
MGVLHQQHMRNLLVWSKKAFLSLSHVLRKCVLWQSLKRRIWAHVQNSSATCNQVFVLIPSQVTQTRRAQCSTLCSHVSAEVLKYRIDCTSLSLSLSLSKPWKLPNPLNPWDW